MRFIDTHLHLSAQEFQRDLDEVILRAKASDVRYMITIGSGYGAENYYNAVEIAERYDLLFAVGVHPHDADLGTGIRTPGPLYQAKIQQILHHIRSLTNNYKMVAIGEIGLDYYYNHSEKKIQKETFLRSLELSDDLKMPVIIHLRDAFDDMIELIRDFKDIKGVFHCFSGDIRQAKALLDMGFYISLSGILTFEKANEMRKVVEYLPLDRILIETDSPFLAPTPYRGKRNEPSFIVKTYERIAEIKRILIDELARQVILNTKNCLRIKEGYLDDPD